MLTQFSDMIYTNTCVRKKRGVITMDTTRIEKVYKDKKDLIDFTENVVNQITEILSNEVEDCETVLELLANKGNEILTKM